MDAQKAERKKIYNQTYIAIPAAVTAKASGECKPS